MLEDAIDATETRRADPRGHRHQELVTSDLVMVVAIFAALTFAFTNGFHDTFDVSRQRSRPGRPPPQVAISVAALLNFVGAFLSVGVAATIAHHVVNADAITPAVVFAGLVGAIAWNLATWRLGLPSSSSHALIGGLVGATLAAAGTDGVIGGGLLDKVLIPALLAPAGGLPVAGRDRLHLPVARPAPPVPRDPVFRRCQISRRGCWRSATAPTTRRRRWG